MAITSARWARWRPWAHPPHWGADLGLAILLLLMGTAWLVVDAWLVLGLEEWGAQGRHAGIVKARLAHTDRVRATLILVLVTAVLAGLFRAYWTVLSQVLLALLAWELLVSS
ncbi:DUF6234 family protein [Streptomyces sp. NPDC006530]|uniref:DUF6234 family protein n=1 Tax=Streptomyces sp. NPDC006530 TaxID=3364750 RepID=UPI0036A637DB